MFQVESETEHSEQKVSETTGRLLELERELGLLRQNNLEMNQKVETAERVSERAKLIAEEAQKVSNLSNLGSFTAAHLKSLPL